jgi:hypothetical protein
LRGEDRKRTESGARALFLSLARSLTLARARDLSLSLSLSRSLSFALSLSRARARARALSLSLSFYKVRRPRGPRAWVRALGKGVERTNRTFGSHPLRRLSSHGDNTDPWRGPSAVFKRLAVVLLYGRRASVVGFAEPALPLLATRRHISKHFRGEPHT